MIIANGEKPARLHICKFGLLLVTKMLIVEKPLKIELLNAC